MKIPRKDIARAIKLAKRGLGDLDRLIEALAADYVKAQADLEAKAAIAFASGKLNSIQYRELRKREAQRILRLVNKLSKPKAKAVVRESVRLGDRSVKKVGVFKDDSSFGRINQQSVSILTDNLTNRLEEASTTVGRRIDDVYRTEGLRLAALQLSDEATLPKASEQLVRRLQKRGVSAFTDRAGRQWRLDAYAKMAIRTVSSEAVFTGARNSILARGFDLVEVNKVANPCDICKWYEGKIFSLTGRSKKYPELKIIFPIHPNCRHFITMSALALDEREEYEQKVAA